MDAATKKGQKPMIDVWVRNRIAVEPTPERATAAILHHIAEGSASDEPVEFTFNHNGIRYTVSAEQEG